MVDRSHYFATAANGWSDDLLGAWRWLIGPAPYVVHRVTAMGSVFVRDDAGAIYFLDTTDGTFQRVLDSPDGFDALFEATENRRFLLWSFFIREMRKRGVLLGDRQCYGWKVSTRLGGTPTYDNVEPTDVSVHVSVQGQIHEQVRSLEPGERVEEVRIEAPGMSWWRRLFGGGRVT